MAIHHHETAHTLARLLRKEPTHAEQVLWKMLRGKQLDGLRFRRQMPIGPYVVDFCCVSRRIVVEADGGIHLLTEAKDAVRDAWLVQQGFTVLRFPNEVVIGKPNAVFASIRAEVGRKKPVGTPHPSRSARHLPPQGGKDVKPEIWFYHLERSTLDQVLPELLDKTLQRGWRALVRISDQARLEEIDERLWTYSDDSFLPHGLDTEAHADRQPIVLTAGQAEAVNSATVRFMVDGATPPDLSGYERVVFMFDGHDDRQLATARDQWRRLKSEGHALTYWQQGPGGRWQKKA